MREWLALRDVGVETLASLAVLDTSDHDFLEAYLSQVSAPAPSDRATRVGRRAGAASPRRHHHEADDVRPTRGARGTDVEIDFDIEWDANQRVYLWGFRVAAGGDHYYKAFTRWTALDEASERELADEMRRGCDSSCSQLRDDGLSVRVFHYTPAEVTHLKRVSARRTSPTSWTRPADLFPLLRENFFGVRGLGIKEVAPAFGFRWRDDRPRWPAVTGLGRDRTPARGLGRLAGGSRPTPRL